MSLVVNNNMMADNAARTLNNHYGNLATSTQRLSSGLRINGAADDAAGLAIRELQRADIATMHQGARNVNDAISMIQVADGSLSIIDEKLIRMKELAEQAATGTYDSTQRLMIESEYQAMASEISRIAHATDFNGIHLLDGSLKGKHDGSGLNSTGAMKIHFGTGNDSAEDYYYVEIGNCTAAALGVGNGIRTSKVTQQTESHVETKYFIEHQNYNKGQRTELTKKPGLAYGVSLRPWDPQPDPDTIFEVYDLPLGYLDGKGNFVSLWDGTITPDDGRQRYPVIGSDARVFTEAWGTPNRREGLLCQYLTNPDQYLSPVLEKFVWSEEVVIYEETKETITMVADSAIPGYTISTQEAAQRAIVAINEAIVSKDKIRAHLGAMQNRLENTVSNLTIQAENLQASESRISDVDVATEMTNFVRKQILTQAAVAMLSQANSMPQMVMQLIG